MNVSIIGLGHHTPDVVLTNDEIVRRFGLRVDAKWIEERTGIRQRHWMREGETTSDLVTAAANRVLEASSTDPKDIDLFILATVSPDHSSPSTATIASRKIGLKCQAFDVSAACSGFLYAVEMATNALKSGGRKRALVIAADARSRYIDPTNHRATVLFADAAAGVLLGASEAPGFLSIRTGAEASEDLGAWIPAGGAALPTTAETVARGLHYIHVDKKEAIFDNVVKYSRVICAEVLAHAGLAIDDIDLLICHQGNARMVELVLDALRFPAERAVNNIALHGNVSGATVPLALSEAAKEGRIRRGDKVLLTSVGAGYTFAAAVHQFSELPRFA